MAKQRVIKSITLSEVEYIAFRLAREHLSFDEPIPDFTTRFPNILESCLITPFQRVYGQVLYPGLVSKAGMLFYLMIKNHPFINGNKRLAITTLLVLLYKNDKWLKMSPKKLHEFTIWVAQSPAELKDQVVLATQKFIKNYLQDLDQC